MKTEKNKKVVMECSQAVAHAVKQCNPGVIAAYPITPQTHIVETLADYVNKGLLNSKYINVESEHSALSACIGAQATGVRTFTATNSQGLALMSEILFITSGMRLPVVMGISNRALSAPLNIWNDHSDSIAQRDSGWIQLYCEDSQEAYDTTIQAYKIAESVNLPVMVCIDGFTLSHVWENVEILEDNNVSSFLPKYKPLFKLDPDKPLTMGPIVMPDLYTEFKKQQQNAIIKSADMIKQINSEFLDKFSRNYGDGLIERYMMDDADYAFIAMGSVCGTIRYAIDKLRNKGKKAGLIKVRCFRPFPNGGIIKSCENLKGVAVIDKDISLGNAGSLYTETKAALKESKIKINNFIAGLGGRDITPEMLISCLDKIGSKEEIIWL